MHYAFYSVPSRSRFVAQAPDLRSMTVLRRTSVHQVVFVHSCIHPPNYMITMKRTFMHCSKSLSRSFTSHSATRTAVPSFSTRSSAARAPTPSGLPTAKDRRCIHSTSHDDAARQSRPHESKPRTNQDRQTDFSALDVLRNTAAPATSIDACTSEGFALNNNMRIAGCGLFLLGGEAYRWRPWLSEHNPVRGGANGDDAMTGRLLNAKGQWEVPNEAWGLLDLVWPKPGTMCLWNFKRA